MLVINDAKFKYGDFVAVQNINLTIKPGEIYGLLGSNGSGKSTTFRGIMGLLEPHLGSITYFGKPVSYENVNDFGYMTEERSLLKKMTTKEMILYFGQLKDLEPSVILERLDYWLDFFDITDYKDKKTQELSKGNQQKVQFISSIINEPKLLVLDEPFSGLDPINTDLFVKAIRIFQDKGSMIVFSSHQLDHVESFCQQVTILEKGIVILSGNIKDIKKDFGKQNINIVGDVDKNELLKIKGVYQVDQDEEKVIARIENDSYVQNVFDYIKTRPNIRKFEVEDAKLSEVFIAKVSDIRLKNPNNGGFANEEI